MPDGFPDVATFVFSDRNGNGVDDGRETQANVFEAMFRTMNRHRHLRVAELRQIIEMLRASQP